jgi:hypothetical protein
MQFPTLVLGALLAAGPQPDWFTSLYTREGIELRADERVFALYALLNAMGYDEGPVVRQHPLPRHQFHPVRAAIRLKLSAADPEVRAQANTFFDAHPRPIDRYLADTVHGTRPPLEALLETAYTRWNLGELMAEVHAEYRKALKAYMPVVDGPVLDARKLLRVADGGPRPVLVMNLLEAENKVSAVMGNGEVVIVLGPSQQPDVERLVTEYARVLVEPAIASRAQGGWRGGASLLREAQLAGAPETTVGEYATALFSRAVALRAIRAPDTAYEALARKGYFGVKDIAQRLDEQRPVNAWALEALQRAETRRPAKK